MQHTDSPQDPVNKLAPKQPGAPAADDHDRMGPPSEETIRRGYELDAYDTKSVISVPLLVILFFVLAFGTVTIIFSQIAYPKKGDPGAHPAATERNKRPLNERLAGIGRDESTKQTREQPRIEPLKQRTGGELARAITRPETAEGNSPELHPEDLRVTKERFPTLYESGGGKHGIDKVMGLTDDKLKDVFKVQQNGTKPLDSRHLPSASNAGRGAEESVATPPAAPKLKDEKKGDAGLPKIPIAPDPKSGDKKPEDKKQPEGKQPDGKAPEPKPGEPKPGEKK
jgi:hypothetical protein